MEDRFSQLEMDVGDVERVETQKSESEKEKRAYQKNPANIKIEESALYYPDEDTELELVSPDQEIFKKVAGDIKRSGESRDIPYSAWNRHDDSDEHTPGLDDTYANTAETEHNFMKTFGIIESNTAKSVSMDETNQTTAEIEAQQGDIHSDYYEYTDRQQRKEIIGMYKYAKKSIKIKLIIASVFAFLLLLAENIGFFAPALYERMNIAAHPYIFFFVDMFLLVGAMVCAYEQLYYGGKSILAKEHIPESICVYSCLVSLAYSLVTLIFVPFGFQQKLYNFPVALICALALAYSFINVIREKYGFSVVSAKETKFVINKLSGDDAETEYETFTTTGDDISGNVNIVKVDKAVFVKRYFARTNTSADVKNIMDAYSIATLIIPLVFFIIAIIRGSLFTDALAVWYEGFLVSLPVGFLFTYSVPFLMGNRKLFNEETSIIGEDAIKEFSDIRVVSVNDTTAFPPYNVKLQNFKVYNDFDIEKILYYAVSGFSVVGGPLAGVFDVATRDAMQKSKKTKFICSGRSFFCVKVDTDTLIFADRYGIASQGVEVPTEKESLDDGVSVMYMACNGKLCAKMYINYMIDEEFARTVRTLNKNGTAVMIRTFDPNLNNEIIKKQTVFKKSELCVIKLTDNSQASKVIDKADSGLVSKGRSRSLLKAIPVCKCITKIRKAALVVKVIASITGLAFLGLTVFGVLSAVPTLFVGLFYIPWMLIIFAISAIYLARIN